MENDTKIYLITVKEFNNIIVSHGVGNNTFNNYVLSQDPIRNYINGGALYDERVQEWFIEVN